ncbi:Tannase/feruloyl esterase [Ilyonectria robusta]|uniref:Tannase/feruloyl esterase n=1 Tax=Ilyonectria robusta TaxID=1079257 RepID=UPI001E8EA80A|nr:Tannase/feruloyl esterase [Ilyonectria robusta]KAH8714639.1 Tannase/feruloyl esterase [Ilyonectria robusta]
MAWDLLRGDFNPLGWTSQWLGHAPLDLSLKCNSSSLSLPEIPGVSVLSVSANEQRNHTYEPPVSPGLPSSDTLRDLNFCNITVTYTHPGWNDTIHVNALLPTENWNSRFLGIGGGGLVTGGGIFSHFMMLPFMASGFAVATTDGGHSSDPSEAMPHESSWALTAPGTVNWPLLIDFASQALHDTATIGKAVTEAFYETPPKYSYFHGASTGGRQGHMLAQRYPQDYDGIIALFPAINWMNFLWSSIWPKFVMDQLRVYPRPCEVDAITAAAVAACDKLDGVEDGIISKPALCDFDAHSVIGQTIDCDGVDVAISTAAADVVSKTWAGPRSATGEFQWYGFNKDTHMTRPRFGPILTKCTKEGSCEGQTFAVSNVWARYWVVKDPSFDMSTITHEQWDDLTHACIEEYESIVGTSNPNLSAFKRRGGKMVNWHGMVDPAIPVNGSTDYYDRVLKKDPDASDYYRLFLAPGAGHCFGCGPTPPLTMDYIVDWVEKGIAPETLRASGPDGNGVAVERDLCMYPRVQHYVGGDATVPSSFACV